MPDTVVIAEFEIESSSLSASYIEMVAAGENRLGDKLLIRNTTIFRLQFRLGEDDANTLTVSPSEKFLIGGFTALAGRKIEVRTVANVTESIRLNIYS